MFRRRRFLALVHALLAPWTWCGLGLAAALILWPPPPRQNPLGGAGAGSAAPAGDGGPIPLAVAVGTGPTPHPRVLVVGINLDTSSIFAGYPPHGSAVHLDRWGLRYLTKGHFRSDERSTLLRISLWWLAGGPLLWGGANLWRWARRGEGAAAV